MIENGELLQVEDLKLSLVSGGVRRGVLTNVSFTLRQGEALGLVGESGSGKSMTTRSLMRLLPSHAQLSGRIRFDGRDVLTMTQRDLQAYRSSDVAMIFQDPRAHINPLRTIGDFLVEAVVVQGRMKRPAAEERAERLLEEVGVGNAARRLRQRPHELSGGLLQRVMIAAALLAEPRLLLADEISTALDVTTQEEVMAILDEQRRQRNLSMVFITHDLDLAAAVCDRLLVMKDGRVVECLEVSDIESAADPYTRQLMSARVPFAQVTPETEIGATT